MASHSENCDGYTSYIKDGKLHEQCSDCQLSRTAPPTEICVICNIKKTGSYLYVEMVSNYFLSRRDKHKARIGTGEVYTLKRLHM